MWARTSAPYVGTDLGMARASLLYSKQVFLFQFLVIDRRKIRLPSGVLSLALPVGPFSQ